MSTPSMAATNVSSSTIQRDASRVLSHPGEPGIVPPAEERYEFRGTLGRGGMGEVHRVFDRSIRREVALKLLRPDRTTSELVSRFVEEGQIAGQLSHRVGRR